jgi:hypothetical protein
VYHVIEPRSAKRRVTVERGQQNAPTAANNGPAGTTATLSRPPGRRPKVQRRRQIDPTTCERDYKDDEIEFMTAMDRYKRENGRPFPTCGEVLEVLRSLGYRRDEGSRGR